MVLSNSAIRVHTAGTGVLIERLAIRFVQLFLEEGEVLHDGGAVSDIARSHASHLRSILLTLRVLDCVVGLHSHLATEVMKVSVASIHVNANFLPSVFQFFQLGVNLVVRFNYDLLTSEVFRNR